jgi:hypothetical protein
MFRSAWPRGILVSLFPALLLLPVIHFHPAVEHGDETYGVHSHSAVVHADFFPSAAHDHRDSHERTAEPDDEPPSVRPQIGLLTLLSRSVVLLTPSLACALDTLAVQEWLVATLHVYHSWLRIRDHAPPVLDFAVLPTSPRAPPLYI